MIEQIKDYIYSLLQQNEIATDWQDTACHGVLLLLAITFSWFIGWICRRLVAPTILGLVKKTATTWDDYLLNTKMVRAACRVVPGIVFYILLPFCLPKSHELFTVMAIQGSKIYIVATFISLVIVFLNNVETLTREEEKLKERHLYGIIEFLKIVVYFIGAIIIIAFLLGENPLSMVAGIGAAATVLMLVFKDSILGLVAGVQLSINHMIKPGDWITIKKSDIDGEVETVSLTTVKIRNFDNTIYTVPPYSLISESFQNWSSIYKGGGRRMKRALYIDQESITFVDDLLLQRLVEAGILTKEEALASKGKVNLTLYREYTERFLQEQPAVIHSKTVLTRQLTPTPMGLPLEFYLFLNITDFKPFESQCAEYMEHFIALLPLFGLKVYQSVGK